ncbi:hypothetical protein Tco_0792132 [Tanacetum coccineum]
MKILSVLLEITPDLATRAIETPLSSPMGIMWCLCDPTPSGWCKTNAHSTDFDTCCQRWTKSDNQSAAEIREDELLQDNQFVSTASSINRLGIKILMVDSITFGHEMVNILVLGEEYDKVFNHLDILNAPFEGKVFTCAKQVKPYGESLSEAWTRFKDLLQKVPHHGIDLWLQVQIFYDHVTPATRRTINQSVRVQRLMEAHLAPKSSVQGLYRNLDKMDEEMHGIPTMTNVVKWFMRDKDFGPTVRQDTYEIYGRLNDAQDDRSLMSGQLNLLRRDRSTHARIARLMEAEARASREAWIQLL